MEFPRMQWRYLLLVGLLLEWDLCLKMAHNSHMLVCLELTLMAVPLDHHLLLTILEMVIHLLATLDRAMVVDQEEDGEGEAVHPSVLEGVIGAYLEKELQVHKHSQIIGKIGYNDLRTPSQKFSGQTYLKVSHPHILNECLYLPFARVFVTTKP